MVRVALAFVCLTMMTACGTGDEQNGSAASGIAHFVNSPDSARSMALRDAYVDFSFDYPARWSQTPQPIDGTAQNYVRVAAPMVNGYEPEAFLVGYVAGTGNAARDRASLPAGTLALAGQFGASLQNYRIVSSGPARVGGYDSYGWRFTATAPGVNGEPPVQIYGRGDLILPPGASRGVTLVAMATSRAGDIHNAAEVGERGALKAILNSFRVATSNAPPPVAAAPSPAPAVEPPAQPSTPAPTPAAPPPPRPHPAPPAVPVTSTPPAAAPRPEPAAPVPPVAPATPERPKQEQPSPPPPPREPPAGNGQ
jgi:hypothetical protein